MARFQWIWTTGRWAGRLIGGAVVVLACALGYGITNRDYQAMRQFCDAVERWQHEPEFRDVQVEYVTRGNLAMQTRICGLSATTIVMTLRSAPGLPEHLRVNSTSLAHYTNFTHGPLTAYLHLCGEQGLDNVTGKITDLGRAQPLTDEDIRLFLRGFHLHDPVVEDAGAIQSVRQLLADTNAGNGFAIQTNIKMLAVPHIEATARQQGIKASLQEMTIDQQRQVWLAMDKEIHDTDYELWRTKQVNDFLNGVWAQAYGRMYSDLIGGVVRVRDVSRVSAPLLLGAWIGLEVLRRQRRKMRQEELAGGGAAQPAVGG